VIRPASDGLGPRHSATASLLKHQKETGSEHQEGESPEYETEVVRFVHTDRRHCKRENPSDVRQTAGERTMFTGRS
jgi:hypothetical protein